MDKTEIIEGTRKFVELRLGSNSAGHDYWHVYRVWQIAKQIARNERGVDNFVLELAALLHDIADYKFHDGDTEAGPTAIRDWLKGQGVNKTVIDQVRLIVASSSYNASLEADSTPLTVEARIIHDADKLDAIGAIGIGRAFAYAGAKGRLMYDPTLNPNLHMTATEYRTSKSAAINHFYEKLLTLKDRMLTKTGREIAVKRHKILEDFLDEFLAEWDGER